MNKIWYRLFFFSIICAGIISLYNDIKLQDTYPTDLRNRIVGSRIMKDGLSPYFYHWQQGDSIRYFEPLTLTMMEGLKISTCTSTPFFHLLLEPIADLPQVQLNILWMAAQYFMLLACLYLIANTTPFSSDPNKILLGITLVLFTYCYGWRFHTSSGQNYIFISFFASLLYFCMKNSKALVFIVLAGFSAAALVLLKLITAFILLPFIFFPKRFLAVGISSLAALLLYLLFCITNLNQLKNWQDYFASSVQHEAMHRSHLEAIPFANKAIVLITPQKKPASLLQFEGVLSNNDYPNKAKEKLMLGNEYGSFFYLYYLVNKKQASNLLLIGLGLFSVIILMLPMLQLYKKNNQVLEIEELFLLGFIFYRIIEFLLPVPLQMYQWATWLFPLLLFVKTQRQAFSWSSIFVFIGLVFNLFIIPKISFYHTIGQFIILGGFIIFIYRSLLPDKILGLRI